MTPTVQEDVVSMDWWWEKHESEPLERRYRKPLLFKLAIYRHLHEAQTRIERVGHAAVIASKVRGMVRRDKCHTQK